jgi:hypothetical protein
LLAALAVALAFGYACSWLMAYIGLTTRNSEAIQAAAYLVVFPMTLTSSVFLPTQTMPSWLRAFAEHQPITIIANALRGLTLGQGALPAGTRYRRDDAGTDLDRGHPRRFRPHGSTRVPAQQQLITASARREPPQHEGWRARS